MSVDRTQIQLNRRSQPKRTAHLRRVPAPAERDTVFWRRAMTAIWIAAAFLCGATSLGLPLGFGASLDIMVMTLIGTIVLALGSWLIAWLLAVIRLPMPRLFLGGCLTLAGGMLTVLLVIETTLLAALLLSVTYAFVAAGAGIVFALVCSRLSPRRPRPHLVVVAAAFTLLLVPLGIDFSASGLGGSLDDSADSDAPINRVESGSYAYSVLTYGSGVGRRDEFSGGADVLTETVDGSAMLTSWSGLQSWYWGFEPERLPINGTLWLPQGKGPFPLVLIVHGNHIALQPSDQGYSYLGDLLAGKGYAVASVDQNFFNYSPWSGISDSDMRLRAWMLLRHLEELRRLSGEPGQLLSGRLDTDKVLLIGHSRGGQAAAMAADAGRWFSGEEDLRASIVGVAAIAPTDMVVEGKQAQLRDVSYLTLHGSRDADLTVFYGERQYNRTSYSAGSDGFKSAFYIQNANHSRFNSDWGTMDISLPGGLLLNQQGVLSSERQRDAAAFYIGAFADAVLGGDEQARKRLLPNTGVSTGQPGLGVLSQYNEASEQTIADFESGDKTKPGRGVSASASPLFVWSEESLPDRNGDVKGSRGAVLSWHSAGQSSILPDSTKVSTESVTSNSEGGWLRLTGLPSPADTELGGLSFAVTNRSWDLCQRKKACQPQALQLSVVLRDLSGREAEVELSTPLTAPRQDNFMRLAWLDSGISKGKYSRPPEPVRQTIRLSFQQFRSVNSRINMRALDYIELRFRSQSGGGSKLMVDDVNWYSGS
ncbi:Chlorophyllase [Paenibacillaceae bacterium GAS479]|nr:Chlorophyllase [Paenibacillaceae bacterium GAS479]